MTPCTICGCATVGRDDDDEAYCGACYDAHRARAELVPRARRTPDGRLRLVLDIAAMHQPHDEDGGEA